MNRVIFLLHRYLGIALGLVMSVWCLSGLVMMYVQYPELSEADTARSLQPLELSSCCRLPYDLEGLTQVPLDGLQVEMMAGRPVLRAVTRSGERRTIDLSNGRMLGELDEHAAGKVASTYAQVAGVDAYRFAGVLERDQWTVYGAYDVHRPFYRYQGEDDEKTTWYVSSLTGEVVQSTTGSQRFWNWLGAVPHWLYPTLLRQHTTLWSQVVIWLTILGTFLVVLGLWVGIRQFKARRSGRYSPYRGAALWHHYAGLLFGVLTLSWLVSGFFSMNPWGALESRSFAEEEARYQGMPLRLDAELIAQIGQFSGAQPGEDIVRIETQVVDGQRFMVAWDQSGQRRRMTNELREIFPVRQNAIIQAAQTLRPGIGVVEEGWIEEDDAYYYDHHEKRTFPVYRIIFSDGERFYLDRLTGELVYAVDTNRRWYRWIHYGLHRGDFVRAIRARPVWDFMMILLMSGVTVGALTGTWIGLRRLRRRRRAG